MNSIFSEWSFIIDTHTHAHTIYLFLSIDPSLNLREADYFFFPQYVKERCNFLLNGGYCP